MFFQIKKLTFLYWPEKEPKISYAYLNKLNQQFVIINTVIKFDYKWSHKKFQHFKFLVKNDCDKFYQNLVIFRLHIPTAIYKSKKNY